MHCKTCGAYEEAVMAGQAADDVAPCDDYEMTPAFQQWLVDQMRDEVMGQISGAGLDRMAILKDGDHSTDNPK